MKRNKYPILLRDNKFAVGIFFFMIFNLFLIFGPISLVVKEASFSMFLLFFLTGLIILYVIKSTDKTKPRFIVFEKDAVKFVFWDKHEEFIPLEEIKQIDIKGNASKTFNGVMTFVTSDNKIKINTEVLKTVVETVRNLEGKTKIIYTGGNAEETVKYNLNPNPFRKLFYQGVMWFFVFAFFAMGIGINYFLLTHKI